MANACSDIEAAPAERVEEDVVTFQRHVAASDGGMIGRIRMTCSTAVGHRLMKSGLFDAFSKKHPGLKVELVMTERLVSLSGGEADVAIRGGVPTDETPVGKRIANVPWALYATRTYIERNGRPRSLAELDGHTTVGLIEAMANHSAATNRQPTQASRPGAGLRKIGSTFFPNIRGARLEP